MKHSPFFLIGLLASFACGGSGEVAPSLLDAITVSVTPSPISLTVGEKSQLTATAKDDQGNTVSGHPVTWSSTSPSVASVSSSGEVTALTTGSASITATIDGVVGSAAVTVTGVLPTQALEIHQINVGWGGSVLIRGPNGIKILMEAGLPGQGNAAVVPYLKSIGISPAQGLTYTVAGHQHCDHIGGLPEVIQAGYGVQVKNFFNGSPASVPCITAWNNSARTTAAGSPVAPAVGTVIALGNGATLTVVAINGNIIGGGHVTVSDENDRSMALLIKYGGFDYLWASDLGGGMGDNACTGRSGPQTDVETSVIRAISPGGAHPLISTGGIDVIHVNHHGSETSTNANYMNLARPAVALIGTGDRLEADLEFPRKRVLEGVLLSQAPCVTAPAALVLQSEEGRPVGPQTSYAGFSVGDIRIVTDGRTGYTVSANGHVTEGPDERLQAGLPRTFPFDDPVVPTPVALRSREPVPSRIH